MTELEKYHELYSQCVSLLTELHNSNISFVRHPSDFNGRPLRTVLRELKITSTALSQITRRVVTEFKANKRQKLADKKAADAYRKLHPMKKGRKKKKDI